MHLLLGWTMHTVSCWAHAQLGHPPNGCETAFLAWQFGWGGIYGTTRRSKEPGMKAVCWLISHCMVWCRLHQGWNQFLQQPWLKRIRAHLHQPLHNIRTSNLSIYSAIHVNDMCMAARSPGEMQKLRWPWRRFLTCGSWQVHFTVCDHLRSYRNETIAYPKGDTWEITKQINLEEAHPRIPLTLMLSCWILSPIWSWESRWEASILWLLLDPSVLGMGTILMLHLQYST